MQKTQETKFYPWIRKIPWRMKWQTHSSILAWKIPWTEDRGKLQSMGSQRVKHYWAGTHACMQYVMGCFVALVALGSRNWSAVRFRAGKWLTMSDLISQVKTSADMVDRRTPGLLSGPPNLSPQGRPQEIHKKTAWSWGFLVRFYIQRRKGICTSLNNNKIIAKMMYWINCKFSGKLERGKVG